MTEGPNSRSMPAEEKAFSTWNADNESGKSRNPLPKRSYLHKLLSMSNISNMISIWWFPSILRLNQPSPKFPKSSPHYKRLQAIPCRDIERLPSSLPLILRLVEHMDQARCLAASKETVGKKCEPVAMDSIYQRQYVSCSSCSIQFRPTLLEAKWSQVMYSCTSHFRVPSSPSQPDPAILRCENTRRGSSKPPRSGSAWRTSRAINPSHKSSQFPQTWLVWTLQNWRSIEGLPHWIIYHGKLPHWPYPASGTHAWCPRPCQEGVNASVSSCKQLCYFFAQIQSCTWRSSWLSHVKEDIKWMPI